MMFTSQMIQLFAIVLGKDSQRVTEALLREGVLQFINISEVDGEKTDNLSGTKPQASLTDISDLRRRIEGFLHTGGIIPSAPNETDLTNRISVDIEKTNVDYLYFSSASHPGRKVSGLETTSFRIDEELCGSQNHTEIYGVSSLLI